MLLSPSVCLGQEVKVYHCEYHGKGTRVGNYWPTRATILALSPILASCAQLLAGCDRILAVFARIQAAGARNLLLPALEFVQAAWARMQAGAPPCVLLPMPGASHRLALTFASRV